MTQTELILIILALVNVVNVLNCFSLYNIHRAIMKQREDLKYLEMNVETIINENKEN